MRTTRAALRRALPNVDLRGARVYAAFPLAEVLLVPRVRRSYYAGPAARACGPRVARASWVTLVELPRAPFASLQPAVFYVVRTHGRWRAWLRWFPNAARDGELIPRR